MWAGMERSIGKSCGQGAQRELGWRGAWQSFGLTAFSGADLLIPRVCIDPSLILFHPCSDISYQMNYFSWETPGIGRYLTSLTIQGFSFLFLLFLIETNLLWRLRTLVCGICRRRKWVS